jgi:hypothetical protein
MPTYFCPNLSNPDVKRDFNSLVDTIGENQAYLLWHRYEGDMEQISQAVGSIEPITAPRPTAPDIQGEDMPRDKGFATKARSEANKISLKGDPSPVRNQWVKEVDQLFNLVSVRKFKD